MPVNLLQTLEIAENTEELTAPELETAAGYAVKSDVRAGQCPSSTTPTRYRGQDLCTAVYPC